VAERTITVLLGDPRLPDRSKPGGRFTPDDFDQVVRLKAALADIKGANFAFLDDHEQLLDRLCQDRPGFVLNFCDTGYRNDASRELHVPALLELLGIPYSGSGPVALGVCFDKAVVRAVARDCGIAVPREALLSPQDALPDLDYPVFIKPNRADGSLGITTRSIARDRGAAEAYLADLRNELPGASILVQEFLPGEEFSVGIIGNPSPGFTLLPALGIDYSALDPSLPRLLDYGSKTDPSSPYWTDIGFRPADLSEHELAGVHRAATVLFERLGLRDYGRFDYRRDASGRAKLLEINPNPAWCWDGKLARMAALAHESHARLLERIITAALERCFGAAN
jgi:D-alanine-D-alanine ligase